MISSMISRAHSGRIDKISGTAIPFPIDDVDTDMIVPARFLKEITFANMGSYAFYDERFDQNGLSKKHAFNDQRYKGASILLAGSNFGCGSSREHAAHALYRFGIRAIIAKSFSQIFFSNCLAIGLPPLKVDDQTLGSLVSLVVGNPRTEFSISLSSMRINAGSQSFGFSIKRDALQALLSGTWDSVALLLQAADKAKALHDSLPYVQYAKNNQ